MGLARLFRSRWSALFWAAGVLWFAYDVGEGAPSENASVDAEALNAAAAALGEAG